MTRRVLLDESQEATRSFYLRSIDVAHMLDCCPDDVYGLVHRGELPARRQGRFWRFRPWDVEEYLKRKTQRQSRAC